MPSSRVSATGRVVLLGLYSFGIIYFGTRGRLQFPGDEVLGHDKLLHAVAFGGLAVLAFRCSRIVWSSRSSNWAVLASIAFATAVGLLLELIQSFLPYRSMEFADLVADFIGAGIAVGLARRWHWEQPLLPTKT